MFFVHLKREENGDDDDDDKAKANASILFAVGHHHSSSSLSRIDRSIEDRQDVIFLCAFCFHVLRAVIACVC